MLKQLSTFILIIHKSCFNVNYIFSITKKWLFFRSLVHKFLLLMFFKFYSFEKFYKFFTENWKSLAPKTNKFFFGFSRKLTHKSWLLVFVWSNLQNWLLEIKWYCVLWWFIYTFFFGLSLWVNVNFYKKNALVIFSLFLI